MAFEVQASIDLKQWSPVTTVTNLTCALEFTDPDAANLMKRFYRAVLERQSMSGKWYLLSDSVNSQTCTISKAQSPILKSPSSKA